MKSLFALLFLILAVATAWSNPATASPGDERSGQITLKQHQEAAVPAALDGIDLAGAHLVASTESAPRIEAAYSVDASHTAVLDLPAAAFDGPARPVQASLNARPKIGHRRPVETSGPASWKAAMPIRCRTGGNDLAQSILSVSTPSSFGA